jgi:hypothetical protein
MKVNGFRGDPSLKGTENYVEWLKGLQLNIAGADDDMYYACAQGPVSYKKKFKIGCNNIL